MDEPYSDCRGKYFGPKRNGVPHGKGIKYYNEGFSIEGTWENGRITGDLIANLLDTNQTLRIKSKNGKMLRLTVLPDFIQFHERIINFISIPFRLSYVCENGKYLEIEDASKYQNSLFTVVISGKLAFDGKFFLRKTIEFVMDSTPGLTYSGEIKDGKPDGYGEYVRINEKYRGHFFEGKPHGKVKFLQSNETFVKGIFKNGVLHGKAKIFKYHYLNGSIFSEVNYKSSKTLRAVTYENNNIVGISKIFYNGVLRYEGILNNEFEPDGYGTVFNGHDQISGVRKNGVLHGRAVWKTGELEFEAKFLNETPDGIGLYTKNDQVLIAKFANKLIYPLYPYLKSSNWMQFEQAFRDFIKVPGYKSFENATGKYFGETVGNKMQGKGLMRFANQEQYKGMWMDNKMHGVGCYFYQDGSVFRGNFRENMRDGIGILIGAECIYKGQWSNNMMNGKGQLIMKNLRIEAIWQDNSIVGFAKVTTDSDSFLINI